jgi:hypothetical protein
MTVLRCLFAILITLSMPALAWQPLAVEDDPLVRMPGTQPGDGVALEGPNRCLNCHAGFDSDVEPGFMWKGSMMGQAARDPIFWATMTVAMQDSIWALGNPNATDICERCHFPQGWLEGRSDPTNASLMQGSDYDGIHCDFCHTAYDPFFADTYDGTREGNDWNDYWDEASNTGPGSGTLAQGEADVTRDEDASAAAALTQKDGQPLFENDRPSNPNYDEAASGQFFTSTEVQKRASFADAGAKHKMLYSRFHKSRFYCGTCHDVSNPVLANLGASGLPDLKPGALITEQHPAYAYFHVERTFSEFMLSDFGRGDGAATNADFQAQGGDVTHVASCQDCHMSAGAGVAANKTSAVLRPDGSTEHPQSGVPRHDLMGGNSWISWILASLDQNGPVYDPRNVELLDQGPAILTLDLNAGQSPKQNGTELKAASDRALVQLGMAGTLKNLRYNGITGELKLQVQNNTGHKLISGFPEGRRMFVNIKAYDDTDTLVYEVNPYDATVGTLKSMPASPTLGANEAYVDELVYEVHPKSSLTGEAHTFHFVLGDGRAKDNRIPPQGFDIAGAVERHSLPVNPVTHLEDAAYFTAEENAGGYDEARLTLLPGAARIDATLYYQGTSREFIEFLRDEINGVGNTLSSPTPSGEPAAYIIQTDPFFNQLRAWGDTIWDLWEHNHGLDGSGKSVPGIVPVEMHTASTTPLSVTLVDVAATGTQAIHPHHDGGPDAIDGLNDIIPIAVLTTSVASGDSSDFDATQVNPASVRFGIGGAADTDGTATIADADNDGDTDAGFEFLTGDTGIACTDTNAQLTGETYSGEPFQGAAEVTTDCNAQCH